MTFKTGLVIGLGVGYYLGARAGRERYEELAGRLERLRSTDAYQQVRARVLDAVDGGLVQVRGALEDAVPGFGDPDGGGTVVELPYDEDGWPESWADTTRR